MPQRRLKTSRQGGSGFLHRLLSHFMIIQGAGTLDDISVLRYMGPLVLIFDAPIARFRDCLRCRIAWISRDDHRPRSLAPVRPEARWCLGRASKAQGSEQSIRELAPADPPPRAPDKAIQSGRPGTAFLSARTRSTTPSTAAANTSQPARIRQKDVHLQCEPTSTRLPLQLERRATVTFGRSGDGQVNGARIPIRPVSCQIP